MQPSVNAMKSLPNDGINAIKPTRQCGQPLVTELLRVMFSHQMAVETVSVVRGQYASVESACCTMYSGDRHHPGVCQVTLLTRKPRMKQITEQAHSARDTNTYQLSDSRVELPCSHAQIRHT